RECEAQSYRQAKRIVSHRLAVWPVRDCGRITYQGTPKVEAGYKPSNTTETLIGYDRMLCTGGLSHIVVLLSIFSCNKYL
ncbi:MAG: hypothetical protein ACOCWB_09205, partial [Bacteroidota bacterium]